MTTGRNVDRDLGLPEWMRSVERRLEDLGAILNASKTREYSPALTASITNPNVGTTGQVRVGWFSRDGEWADLTVYITFGTAGISSGNGAFAISIPSQVTARTSNGFEPLGGGYVYRAATNQVYVVECVTDNLNGLKLGMAYTNTLAGGVDNLGPGRPGAWAAGDQIRLRLRFLTAAA